MWQPPHRHSYSYEEYLSFERASPTKHEYLNGDIIAMAGGSPEHAAVSMNVGAALNLGLRGRPCRVYSSDLKIRIEAANVATYPDVSVVCGHVELDPKDEKQHTILNPILIVEVLSPSTEDYDLGEKLGFYQQIPSLREIVLVDYEKQRFVVWRKGSIGGWHDEEVTSGGSTTLVSIDCALSVEDVYRNELPAS